jgi:hypothetical protein
MSHSSKKSNVEQKEAAPESFKTQLLEEFSPLPEKFFTFTHEMIAMLWMKETTQVPIRGKHPLRK